jgi:hypothetical protein
MRGSLFGKRLGQAPQLAKGKGGEKGKRNEKGPRREEIAPLKNSEDSWFMQQKKAKENEEDEDTRVIRAMNSILNKLTEEKFEPLYERLVTETGICKESHIIALTRELFAKSTTQHHFIEMYTKLVVRLQEWMAESPIYENSEKQFKRILLNLCQESFELYLKPQTNFDELEGEEKMLAHVKYKRSMLGNMKFVGNLLCSKILSSKIIFECVEQMINPETRSDETVETLAAFLQTIGPMFDTENYSRYKQLDEVFSRVKDLTKEKTLSARVKCLLRDVLDIRAAGWRNSKKTNQPEGPMKLTEVKRQAMREEQGFSGGGYSAPREKPARVADDEWATVGSSRGGSMKKPPSVAHSYAAPTSSTSAANGFAALGRKDKPRETERSMRPVKEEKKVKSEDKPKKKKGKATLEDFKEEFPKILQEFYTAADMDEALGRLRDIGLAEAHHEEAVTEILFLLSDEKPAKREKGLQLLSAAYSPSSDALQPEALAPGIEAYVQGDVFDDLKIDVPQVVDIMRDEALPAVKALIGEAECNRLRELL